MEDIRPGLKTSAQALGLRLTGEQLDRFQRYLELLLDWNERLNLTAITEPAQVAEKHFLDSISLLAFCPLKEGARLIDVGTGAGFPGVPVKILRPDIRLTLLDGSNKRLAFLTELCAALGLPAETVHKRAEEAGRLPAFREQFDVATARAVAPLPVLAEYCLPLVKMKGFFWAMKGPGAEEELTAAGPALALLGGERAQVHRFALPTAGERVLLSVQKRAFTPKAYPRHGGTIVKHPLGAGKPA